MEKEPQKTLSVSNKEIVTVTTMKHIIEIQHMEKENLKF